MERQIIILGKEVQMASLMIGHLSSDLHEVNSEL